LAFIKKGAFYTEMPLLQTQTGRHQHRVEQIRL